MKSVNKLMSLTLAALAMGLTACANTPATSSKAPESSEPEEDPNAVSVFVLSGQSNMEGNTSFKSGSTDLIAQAFEEMGLEDPEILTETGVESVQTSLYCAGYGQLDHTKLDTNTQVNSTNKTERFKGEFVPTKTGLGLNSSKMGPELGMAYALKDEATAEKPIYFIKMASGGSGFEQSGTDYNWPVKNANGEWPEINMYHTFCKPFIENNLALIKEAGWNNLWLARTPNAVSISLAGILIPQLNLNFLIFRSLIFSISWSCLGWLCLSSLCWSCLSWLRLSGLCRSRCRCRCNLFS